MSCLSRLDVPLKDGSKSRWSGVPLSVLHIDSAMTTDEEEGKFNILLQERWRGGRERCEFAGEQK